jgi:hypothetical protein
MILILFGVDVILFVISIIFIVTKEKYWYGIPAAIGVLFSLIFAPMIGIAIRLGYTTNEYQQAKIYSIAYSKIDDLEHKVEAYVFIKKYNEQLIKAQNHNKSIWYDLLIDDDITNYRPVVLPKIK